jgi:hypothetical protein
VNDINPTTINLKNRIARIAPILAVLALVAGCAFDGADDSSEASAVEQEQTFGAPGFPMPVRQRVDPGDVVDTDRNVVCSVTVDPEEVPPTRTVTSVAREACRNQAAAQCAESEVDGVAGVVLYSGTLEMSCNGFACSGRAIVQCLYNVGG